MAAVASLAHPLHGCSDRYCTGFNDTGALLSIDFFWPDKSKKIARVALMAKNSSFTSTPSSIDLPLKHCSKKFGQAAVALPLDYRLLSMGHAGHQSHQQR
jgi:hypothetical protein